MYICTCIEIISFLPNESNSLAGVSSVVAHQNRDWEELRGTLLVSTQTYSLPGVRTK